MCYFLYGAVNNGVNKNDYMQVVRNTAYCFECGDANDVNACVASCGGQYRITSAYCDCETPIGKKDAGMKELNDFKELLCELKNVRGIKYVLLSKNWWEDTNVKQEIVHIDDVDVLQLLADVEDNCLYRIDLYERYK